MLKKCKYCQSFNKILKSIDILDANMLLINNKIYCNLL